MDAVLKIYLFTFFLALNAAQAREWPSAQAVRLRDPDALQSRLDLTPYLKDRAELEDGLASLRLAILDVGFGDIDETNFDDFLPFGSKFFRRYSSMDPLPDFLPGDRKLKYTYHPHGYHMLQAVLGLTGYRRQGPKLCLYNANGPQNFLQATEEMGTGCRPHIVLFSANWEIFGNLDGSGPLNAAVQRLVNKGAIWINAAGNYGGRVRNLSARVLTAEEAAFGFRNNVDDHEVTITVTWPQNAETREVSASLYDTPEVNSYAATALAESVPVEETLVNAETRVYAARLRTRLKGRRSYYLALRAKLGEFQPRENIRVTLQTNKNDSYDEDKEKVLPALELLDKGVTAEIMTPGDSIGLTVGSLAKTSAHGPTLDGRGKPDVVLEADSVQFTDEYSVYGTSYAAGLFAGVVAVLKAHEPGLQAKHLKKFLVGEPEKTLQTAGYRSWSKPDYGSRALSADEREFLEENFDASKLRVKTNADEVTVRVPRPLTSLDLFTELPKAQQKKGHRWFLYQSEQRSEQPQPSRTVLVEQTYVETPGHYETRTRDVRVPGTPVRTQRVIGETTHYIPTNQLVLNPLTGGYEQVVQISKLAQVEVTESPTWVVERQEYQEWVPAVHRKRRVEREIEVPPKIITVREWQLLAVPTAKFRWPNHSHGELASQFIELEYEAPPEFNDEKAVTDGSKKMPRIWKTPSPKKLTQTVREK